MEEKNKQENLEQEANQEQEKDNGVNKIPKIAIVAFIFIVAFYVFATAEMCYRHYTTKKYIEEHQIDIYDYDSLTQLS